MKELRFHGQAIVTGKGSLQYIKSIVDQKVFVVTGGGSMFKNGAIDRIQAMLAENKCPVYIYSGVPQNPPTEAIADGLAKMRDFEPDVVIGVGGGSAIDAAKVMAVFYEHPELDVEKAFRETLPQQRTRIKFIAIPGTSGTATEVTCFAVLTYKQEDLKVGNKTPAFIPDIAILDADLTMSMPPNVVAETGMDAMTHAVECYMNKNLDDFTAVLASGAVEGLFAYLPASYRGDAEAREKVHNYQSIAGCAFTNVGTGMDHGIAHAFGGRFNLGHGLLNAVALPYVIQFNCQDPLVSAKMAYLAKRIGKADFAGAVKELNRQLNIPGSFKELGISEEKFKADFDLLVENSLKGATRVNPVPVSREAMAKILVDLYEGRDFK